MTAVDPDALLEIEGLSKHFGGLQALEAVDLSLTGPGIFGLIGPNGSGKTTLFNAVAGTTPASGGRVRYCGRDITGWAPHRVAHQGIARTFQNLKIFARLTVTDNVAGAQTARPDVRPWQHLLPNAGEASRRARVGELLELVGLADRRDTLAGELPLGEQRRLELARALAREPDLLLLDEPAGGMTPQETDAMADLIQRVADLGPAVLLIEHKMGMVMGLCRWITVLNFGRKIAEGTPDAIQSDPHVREAYLGSGGGHA